MRIWLLVATLALALPSGASEITWSNSIPYCIEIDPTWRREPAWTQNQVRFALDRWLAFFAGNHFEHRPRFAHQMEKCAPEQGALRFLIGVAKPTSAPLKISATRKTGRNVFVDPLTTSAHFPHVLLHEIGLAFDMPLDSVPAMMSDFEKRLEEPAWQSYLGKIEMPTWHYQLREGDAIVYADGAVTNHLLPQTGLAFGLQPHGRHGLRLQIEDLTDQTVTLALMVKDESGQERLNLRGEFQLRTRERCSIILDASVNRDAPREADGVFEDDRGHHYPAILEAAPGSLLRVYIPHNRHWWTVENYPTVRPWRSTPSPARIRPHDG